MSASDASAVPPTAGAVVSAAGLLSGSLLPPILPGVLYLLPILRAHTLIALFAVKPMNLAKDGEGDAWTARSMASSATAVTMPGDVKFSGLAVPRK